MADGANDARNIGTLDWPIGLQLGLTAVLAFGLWLALHLSAENDAVPPPDDQLLAKPLIKPEEKAVELGLPAEEWQGKRVLATLAAVAAAATDAGAEAFLYADAETAASSVPILTADRLATAAAFDVIILAAIENRPPRPFAQKVAAGGTLYLLTDDGAWRAYRETAGMLRADDQR